MSEICMDEEYLELVLPTLQKFVVPSNIAVHLAPHLLRPRFYKSAKSHVFVLFMQIYAFSISYNLVFLRLFVRILICNATHFSSVCFINMMFVILLNHLFQDEIKAIIKAQKQNGTADAIRLLVLSLQMMARTYYKDTGQNQGTPIFTALVNILSERGYEVLNRFLRQPEEITGWKEHLRLFEVYLPQLSMINVNEFIIELISVGLIDVGTPEHDLVKITLKHEGNEMAILEILNQVWRKKINWSEKFIGALRNHMERGGALDEDMIDTMECKIMPDGPSYENLVSRNATTNYQDLHFDASNLYASSELYVEAKQPKKKSQFKKITAAIAKRFQRNYMYPPKPQKEQIYNTWAGHNNSELRRGQSFPDIPGNVESSYVPNATHSLYKDDDTEGYYDYIGTSLNTTGIKELPEPPETPVLDENGPAMSFTERAHHDSLPSRREICDPYVAEADKNIEETQDSGIQKMNDFMRMIQNSIQRQDAVAEFQKNMEFLTEIAVKVDEHNKSMKFFRESIRMKDFKQNAKMFNEYMSKIETFNEFMKNFKQSDANDNL